MANQIGWGRKDETSYGTAGAFDNSLFGQGQNGIDKVAWLLKQMYAKGSANVAKQIKDKRAFDGKFGLTTKAWFDKQGWQVSDGGDTLTRAGHTYRWDPTRKEYVEHISGVVGPETEITALEGKTMDFAGPFSKLNGRSIGKSMADGMDFIAGLPGRFMNFITRKPNADNSRNPNNYGTTNQNAMANRSLKNGGKLVPKNYK